VPPAGFGEASLPVMHRDAMRVLALIGLRGHGNHTKETARPGSGFPREFGEVGERRRGILVRQMSDSDMRGAAQQIVQSQRKPSPFWRSPSASGMRSPAAGL
jgi:hypothetical protein